MQRYQWLERHFSFGMPEKMLPFYLERLEGTMARLETKVKGIPDEVLSHKPDGKWSVKEIIGHLIEVDEVALRRVDEIVSGTSPISCAAMQNKRDYNSLPVDRLLKSFAEVRKKNIARYNYLQKDELSRVSAHPRLKAKMTPIDLAWFDAEHDDHHLVRISEILQEFTRIMTH